MRKAILHIIGLSAIIMVTAFFVDDTFAGITLDGSFGTKGALTGPNYSIPASVGQQTGSNLFHSFGNFSITSAESATFSGPASIQNIISRVTGGQSSSIDGTIHSTINGANLYFINPAGIVFGANAKLDVSGSFHASTADYIKLGDGGRFDATTPSNSLLTSAAPSAFGFIGNTPGGITVNGSSLQVGSGKALSFVGGNLTFSGSNVSAPSGTISLISAASPGEATLSNSGWDVSAFSKSGNISATNSSLIDASGGGGTVYIRGGRFLLDNSSVRSRATGSSGGGLIDINVSDEIDISNNAGISGSTYSDGNASDISINTGILNLTGGGYIASSSNSSGKGGKITIDATKSLLLSGSSSAVNNMVYDVGNGGSIAIETPSLVINSGGGIELSSNGSGKGSSLSLNVGKLEISGGGYIDNNVFSSGGGGDTIINATDSISISDSSSGIYAQTQGGGNAGTISITAPALTVNNSGVIDLSTNSFGKGGSLSLNVGKLQLSGGGGIGYVVYGEGGGGNITINATGSMSISDFSSGVYGKTQGGGNAGTISITTPFLSLTRDGSINSNSGSSFADATGRGGDIVINADRLTISTDTGLIGSTISSDSYGSGGSGNISITANNSVLIDGSSANNNSFLIDGKYVSFPSQITTNCTSGKAGSITINTPDFTMNKNTLVSSWTSGSGQGGSVTINTNNFTFAGGEISTSTSSSGRAGDISLTATGTMSIAGALTGSGLFESSSQIDSLTIGAGNAGNIDISAHYLNLGSGGQIAAGSDSTLSSGNGGTIYVKGDQISLSGGQVLAYTYGKGLGGDITIDASNFIVEAGGKVNASSYGQGNAGHIAITATDSVLITGGNSVVSSGTSAKGNAGDISIETAGLSIADGGEIVTSAEAGSGGNAGSVKIKAGDSVSIAGHYDSGGALYQSGIFSVTFAKGGAGDISIETAKLSLSDLGTISTSAMAGSEGNGGSISIKASDSVSVAGHYDSGGTVSESGIFSVTLGKGSAGDIAIETTKLSLSDLGSISTGVGAGSEGNGGSISIKASDSISVTGYYENAGSGIFSVTYGKGSAGDISIETAKLSLSDLGTINTSARPGSEGNGGSISIKAGDSISIAGSDTSRETAYT
ncbi:MAG: filamentous hemagglutinin N-terminal domain-containing protein, partial [Nitrospirae bacterium]|nr:filamentous hemagglutinin N-terminal domain-containing protein [Nitrospirota bacterium]